MNNEYNKLEDVAHQKDFMMSANKNKKNIQKVYFSNINNLKYFKEVIDFMDFGNDYYIINITDTEKEGDESNQFPSKSHNTSLISDIKEESMDKLNEDSGQLDKNNINTKDEQHKIIRNIDINQIRDKEKEEEKEAEERKYNAPQVIENEVEEEMLKNLNEVPKFKKDIEFYFTYYSQEVLNAITSLL